MDVNQFNYDADAEPCSHCGSHWTHFTEYHGSYDCHCECCGRVFYSRGRGIDVFDERMSENVGDTSHD